MALTLIIDSLVTRLAYFGTCCSDPFLPHQTSFQLAAQLQLAGRKYGRKYARFTQEIHLFSTETSWGGENKHTHTHTLRKGNTEVGGASYLPISLALPVLDVVVQVGDVLPHGGVVAGQRVGDDHVQVASSRSEGHVAGRPQSR